MHKGRNTFLIGLAICAVVMAFGIPAFMSAFYDSVKNESPVLYDMQQQDGEVDAIVPLALLVRDHGSSNVKVNVQQVIESELPLNPGIEPNPDRMSLGGRSLIDISDTFEFALLKEQDGHLVIDHSLKGVIERMYDVLPAVELSNGRQMLESAAALNVGRGAAKEFKETVLEFVDYKEKMAALDDELNAMNFKPEDVPSTESLLAQLQDSAFGYEKATALFRVERAVNHAMEEYREEYQASSASMKTEDWNRINQEYRSLIEEVQQTN